MAVTAKWYGKSILNQYGSAPVNWTADTIKVSLHTSSYSPNQDTDTFFSDVTNEITGTGYTAGGATLTTPTKTYTGSTNVMKLTGDNSSWTTATITARYAVIYKSTGTAGTSQLLGYVDFGADVSSTAATFTIVWDSSGMFTITPA